MLQILYNDGHIVAVVKPAGVLSEDKGEGSMPALLRAELGCAYIGCVHRLDRAVGGVMVYALDQPSCGKLSAMVASHQMVKEYLAVVHGCPESSEGEMRDLLFKDSARQQVFCRQADAERCPGSGIALPAAGDIRAGERDFFAGTDSTGDWAQPSDPGAVFFPEDAVGRRPAVREPGGCGRRETVVLSNYAPRRKGILL